MSELDSWVVAACAELGLDSRGVPVKQVLDLAKDVAHQVVRPGAPVSAFLLGVAVGQGADPAETAARLSALALGWPARATAATPGPQIPGEGANDEGVAR